MEKRDLDRTRKLLRLKITNFTPAIQGACLNVSATGMKIKIRSKRLFNSSETLNLNVVANQNSYQIKASLCWSKRTVLETMVGVHFKKAPMRFLRDILHMEPGSEAFPFHIQLKNNDAESGEFFTNLKYGGVVIKDDTSASEPIRPQLHTSVFVKVEMGPYLPEAQFKGVVVAHMPNGFGLRVDNFTEVMNRLLPG